MNRSDFLKSLNKTFPLFRIFGFDIRFHWTAFLLLLLSLHVHGVLVGGTTTDLSPLILAFMGVFQLFAIVLIHELGHSFAARALDIPVREILLTPIGGMACLDSAPHGPREELIVTLWGPAVHPLMLILGGPLYYLVSADIWDLGFYGNYAAYQFFWLNVGLLAFNLLPAFPMDGGRILRALLARRIDAGRATIIAAYIGQLASVIFIVVAVASFDNFRFLLVVIGIMNLVACEQAKIMARHQDPYPVNVDNPYGLQYYDPKPGDYSYDEVKAERGPGPITRYFQERTRRREEAAERQEAQTKERVDELLEKVSDVGMSGLTPDEQRFLKKASDLYKKSGEC